MLWLAIQILLGLLFLAAIALLATKEVVILAGRADPATIREVELFFNSRVLLLLIGTS